MIESSESTDLGVSGTEYRSLHAGGSVSLLEPVLWKHLVDAVDFDDLAAAWLALQCEMIGGVQRAAVVRIGGDGQRNGVAIWPSRATDVSSLSPIVDSALLQKRGVVQRVGLGEISNNERSRGKGLVFARIGYPLEVEGAESGVVALEVGTSGADSVRVAMRDLQWGVAWLREGLVREHTEGYRRSAEHTASALEVLAVALEEERFAEACRAVVTKLALNASCGRVSIGFRRSGTCTVKSISHSARFGKRMNLVRMLGAAMDEAIDQRAVIRLPQTSEVLHICRAHEELARAHASGAILTVPMFVHDRFVGALSLEREEDVPFGGDEVAYVQSVSGVISPMLEEKRQNDRWIVVKLGDSLVNQLRRLLGPGYFKRKLAAIVMTLTVAFFYFATSDYDVTADAVVEGRIQRAVVAAFDGFIKDAEVRVGDVVESGEFLVSLDDRSFLLERLRWVAERQKSLYEYERALGERNRAASRIAKSQVEHADAWVNLIDRQIARTRMAAPFDGVIVSGDLSQSIGSAVQRGQVLLEVAPLDSYRVNLKVDESQIRDVERGSRGRLRVAALPDGTFPVVVEKVTPVAVAEGGRNFLRVEASLEGEVKRLRPGMSGVCHIHVDERRLIWIWTRGFMDWLHVFAWRWLG